MRELLARAPAKAAIPTSRLRWRFFLSHVQKESAVYAEALFGALESCWLDVKMPDKSQKGMEEGVRESDFFLCILSDSYFKSEWCLMELRWAVQQGKPVISTYTKGCNVGALLLTAPLDVSGIKNVDSLELDRDPRIFQIRLDDIRKQVSSGGKVISAASLLEEPIESFLAALSLDRFAAPLKEAGCDRASDLLLLEAEELTKELGKAGLGVLQQKKLQKLLGEERAKLAEGR